jgi:hypothetical protein
MREKSVIVIKSRLWNGYETHAMIYLCAYHFSPYSTIFQSYDGGHFLLVEERIRDHRSSASKLTNFLTQSHRSEQDSNWRGLDFTVLRSGQEFSLEGQQNLGLCSALRAFEEGGIFILPHLLWHRPSDFLVSSKGSHRTIQSPLTTRMWIRRIYSNPDPHGVRRAGGQRPCVLRPMS